MNEIEMVIEEKIDTIELVIPIKNEMGNLYHFVDKYRNEVEYIEKYLGKIRVTFVDDSDRYKKGFLESIPAYEKFDYRFLRGSGNYGDSLLKGMLRGGEYDKLIVMDIDHPINRISEMIMKLDKYDVVIGNDLNQGLIRRFTGYLCNKILGLVLNHPTCGFIGFNSYVVRLVDDRNIGFYFARSKRDIIHVEWMVQCRKKNLKVGQIKFNTLGSGVKHNYTIKRCIVWLWDFLMTSVRTMIGLYP